MIADRLKEAYKGLKKSWRGVKEDWSDNRSRKFENEHMMGVDYAIIPLIKDLENIEKEIQQIKKIIENERRNLR